MITGFIKYSIFSLSFATLTPLHAMESINTQLEKKSYNNVKTLLELTSIVALDIISKDLKPLLISLKNASLEKHFAAHTNKKEEDKKITSLIEAIKNYFLNLPTTHPNLLQTYIYEHIFDFIYPWADKLTLNKLQVYLSDYQPDHYADIWHENEMVCYYNLHRLKQFLDKTLFENTWTPDSFMHEISSLSAIGVLSHYSKSKHREYLLRTLDTPPSFCNKPPYKETTKWLKDFYHKKEDDLEIFNLSEVSPEALNCFIKQFKPQEKPRIIMWLLFSPFIYEYLYDQYPIKELQKITSILYIDELKETLNQESILSSLFNLIVIDREHINFWPYYRNYFKNIHFWEKLTSHTHTSLQAFLHTLQEYIQDEFKALDNKQHIQDNYEKIRSSIIQSLTNIQEVIQLLNTN